MKSPNAFRIALLTAIILGMLLIPGFALAQDSDVASQEAESTASSTEDAHDNAEDDEKAETDKVKMSDMLTSEGEANAEADEERGDNADEATPPQNTNQQTLRTTHWSWIIAGNALAGGLAGGLIAVAVLLVRGDPWDTMFVGQFIGGGILVGASLGTLQLVFGSTSSRLPDQPGTLELMERDMPTIYGTDVIRLEF